MKPCSVLIGCISIAVAAQTTAPSPIGIWRSTDRKIQWVYAPRDLGYKQRGGNATILRFNEDRSFALIYDTIYEQDGRETASGGDSWTVFYGTWRMDGGRLFVSYSPAYIDIPHVVNHRLTCDSPVKDLLISFRGSALIFNKETLRRAPS